MSVCAPSASHELVSDPDRVGIKVDQSRAVALGRKRIRREAAVQGRLEAIQTARNGGIVEKPGQRGSHLTDRIFDAVGAPAQGAGDNRKAEGRDGSENRQG